MSARNFLAGFAKSVLVHRHAFIASPSQAVDLGRTARLPHSFAEAFGEAAPPRVDAAFTAGRWPSARAALKDWARRRPDRPEPRLIEALLRLWTAPGTPVRRGPLDRMIDRYASQDGIKALRCVAQNYPDSDSVRLWLSLALLRRTDIPAAWRELNTLVARRPDWVWPSLIRSELARVDILYAESLRDLAAAERLEPSNPWVHAFRARVLFQADPGATAVAAMDRAVRLAPQVGWIRAWRADARRKMGNISGATADLAKAMRTEPSYDRIYLWLGKILRARNRPREAERVLTRGLRYCPHFEKAFAERYRVRMTLGDVDAALIDLESAAAINHRHNALWNWTATIEPLTPDKVRTIEVLATHASSSPRSARAWAWLGESLTQAGRLGEGLETLDRALRLRPGHAWAHAWRGEAMMRLGRLPEAEEALDESLRLDPFYGRANAFRGRVRFLRGDSRGAVKDLEVAVSDAMIEYAGMYRWRSQAYAACGKRRQAGEDARAAAALDPGMAGREHRVGAH